MEIDVISIQHFIYTRLLAELLCRKIYSKSNLFLSIFLDLVSWRATCDIVLDYNCNCEANEYLVSFSMYGLLQQSTHLQIGNYAARNDAILLVIVPALQAPDVASSRALRIARELDSEGLFDSIKF
mgnify:CR=1 FL=1